MVSGDTVWTAHLTERRLHQQDARFDNAVTRAAGLGECERPRLVAAPEVLARRERLSRGKQQVQPVRGAAFELRGFSPLPLGAFAQVVDLLEHR